MDKVVYLHTPMAKATEDLPNQIRHFRKLRGLTLDQLGDRIGMSKQGLGMLERGDRPLTDAHRLAIARELEVDPADLFLPEQTPFTVPQAERDFWNHYLSLDAHGRRTVRNVAENLVAWRGEAEDGIEKKSA